eukprot:jgi/Tetstr1/425269/TSEL_015722.t1
MPTHDSPGLVQTPGRKLRSVNLPTYFSPVLSAVGQGKLSSAAGEGASPRSPGDCYCASPGYVRFVDKRAPDKLLNTAGAPVGPGTPAAQLTCYELGYSRSGGGLKLTRHLADDPHRAGAKRRAGADPEAASNVETAVLFIQDTTAGN